MADHPRNCAVVLVDYLFFWQASQEAENRARSRGDDDEEGDEVRERHPDPGVDVEVFVPYHRAGDGSCWARLLARPRRDCQPMVALMIWIATMNGRVRNMVQQSVKPNCAPA